MVSMNFMQYYFSNCPYQGCPRTARGPYVANLKGLCGPLSILEFCYSYLKEYFWSSLDLKY